MKKTLIGKAASYGSTATTKDGARRYLIKHIKTLREKARPLEKRGRSGRASITEVSGSVA